MIRRALNFLLVGAGFLIEPAAVGQAAAASSCRASSSAQRVSVVELYTSEGCSSCPPADRWLSSMVREADADRLVVPLAFHVDYWDYIGWKDAFAQPGFARRQRELASRGGTRTVYTPQVIVDGRDFHGWRDARAVERILSSHPKLKPGAELTIGLEVETAARWTVRVRGKLIGSAASEEADVFVAVYENGLETRVKAGENAGATLRHDFVVREWHGPFRVASSGTIAADLGVDTSADWKTQHVRVAAVAYAANSGMVLQAVSMPACRVSTN